MMSIVNCNKCTETFQTFKLYIKHLLTNECRGKREPEEEFSLEPEDKRLKISSKLFQKKKKKNISNCITENRMDFEPSQTQPTTIPKPAKAPCNLCGKSVKQRGMIQHMTIQHKCMYCNIFVNNVDDHVNETHEKESCEHCGKKFESRTVVEDHVKISHLQTCAICEEEFFSEESLKAHMVDIHESEECDICQVKFLIADKMMDDHKDKEHGIKTKTIKQFGGMMFMMA